MSNKKIVKLPVTPKEPDDAAPKRVNPADVPPARGMMGGCVVLGSAYHGPNGRDDEVELKKVLDNKTKNKS